MDSLAVIQRPVDMDHTGSQREIDSPPNPRYTNASHAEVAELVYAQGLGSCVRKSVEVQVLSSAPWGFVEWIRGVV